MVNDFWDQVRNNGKWRIWNDLGHSEESPLKALLDSLGQDLEHMKILVSSLHDQVRWGKNTKGNFNLKEAKQVVTGFNYLNPDQVWKNIWQSPHSMKIKLFIWLIHHRKILTRENILKKGFIGPYKCYLCGSQEETLDHLLNLFSFTSTMWEWVASIFRHTDRDRFNISNTLKNCRKNFSRNEIISKA